jgi:hypothetical protein
MAKMKTVTVPVPVQLVLTDESVEALRDLLALQAPLGWSNAPDTESSEEELEDDEAVEEEEEDTGDPDDEDDDEFVPVTEDELKDMKLPALREYAEDEWELDVSGKRSPGIRKMILEAQEAYMEELAAEAGSDSDDDEEIPDDPDDLEDDDEEEEDDEDDEEEGDSDEEDDEEFWTEAELKKKSPGELKAIARDYNISTRGMKPKDIVQAIIDA